MIQPNMTPNDIEQKLNKLIDEDEFLRLLGARVLRGTVKHEEWGWKASVGIENEPAKTFEFIEHLGDVSDRYREQEQIDVLIAPSGIKPSEMNR